MALKRNVASDEDRVHVTERTDALPDIPHQQGPEWAFRIHVRRQTVWCPEVNIRDMEQKHGLPTGNRKIEECSRFQASFAII
jgi:hypothetical protein